MKTVNRNLNLNVRRTKRSATLAINERSAELQGLGKKIYRLGLGQSPFPVPDFVVKELQDNAHQKDYLPVAGLAPLREAVSAYHNRRDGLESNADDVLIGPGSKELLFMAQLCFSGELIIPAPSWVSYEPQASILGLPTTWIPTTVEDGWRLQADALKKVCQVDPTRPRLLILNYPNNPAGTTLDKERLKEIAKVCGEFRLLVLSDEIYGEVHHRGQHTSLASYYPEGTVISNGLSKWCGAGGWRLGTFLFPKPLYWLREAMSVVASETYTSVSTPIQYAAIAAYTDRPELQDYLKRSRKVLRMVGETAYHKLRAAGLEVPKPDGGFYLFPDASPLKERLAERGIFTSGALCEQLLQDSGVAVLPGTEFGRPSDELTFRMATVNFDGGEALKAVTNHSGNAESFVKELCPDLWQALEQLTTWLSAKAPLRV
jgi:aspartate aminotransferase